MTKIQLDLDEEENRYVNIQKAKLGFISKADVIKRIIRIQGGMRNESKTKGKV